MRRSKCSYALLSPSVSFSYFQTYCSPVCQSAQGAFCSALSALPTPAGQCGENCHGQNQPDGQPVYPGNLRAQPKRRDHRRADRLCARKQADPHVPQASARPANTAQRPPLSPAPQSLFGIVRRLKCPLLANLALRLRTSSECCRYHSGNAGDPSYPKCFKSASGRRPCNFANNLIFSRKKAPRANP